jgi:hypothetical protein
MRVRFPWAANSYWITYRITESSKNAVGILFGIDLDGYAGSFELLDHCG